MFVENLISETRLNFPFLSRTIKLVSKIKEIGHIDSPE